MGGITKMDITISKLDGWNKTYHLGMKHKMVVKRDIDFTTVILGLSEAFGPGLPWHGRVGRPFAQPPVNWLYEISNREGGHSNFIIHLSDTAQVVFCQLSYGK